MLHILLLIVKIIGITLLIIVGLTLLIILSVLFAPIRYSGRVSYHDEVICDIRVNWLLHILSLRVHYEEVLTARFRVFGFPVYKQTLFGEEEEDSEPELEADLKEGVADTIKDIVRIPKKTVELAEDYDHKPKEKRRDLGSDSEIKPEQKRESKDGTRQTEKQQSGVFCRIKQWFWKLLEKLRFSFRSFCDKLKEIKEKKEGIQDFINDEANRATFSLLLRQGKRFFRHVLPGRIKGRIAFGFDDPYRTGQALMYVSPFLGWSHKRLSLEPYFDRSVLEGDVAFKGRIRIATVLFLGFQVYRDRNFRKLWKQWRE